MAIIINVHKPVKLAETLIGQVKITPEAETVLRELNRQTGLSLRFSASEIITQAADQIEVREAR